MTATAAVTGLCRHGVINDVCELCTTYNQLEAMLDRINRIVELLEGASESNYDCCATDCGPEPRVFLIREVRR